jgi:hypothetical protein
MWPSRVTERGQADVRAAQHGDNTGADASHLACLLPMGDDGRHEKVRPVHTHPCAVSLPCSPLLGRASQCAARPLRARFTTSATVPSRPRCAVWCSNMQRLSSLRPKRPPVPGCRNSSVTSSTPSWSAASWRTASCACAAGIAATTSCWPSVASAVAFARRAARGTWHRRRRIWWTMYFPTCPRIGRILTAGNLPFVGVGLRCTAEIFPAPFLTLNLDGGCRASCRAGPDWVRPYDSSICLLRRGR